MPPAFTAADACFSIIDAAGLRACHALPRHTMRRRDIRAVTPLQAMPRRLIMPIIFRFYAYRFHTRAMMFRFRFAMISFSLLKTCLRDDRLFDAFRHLRGKALRWRVLHFTRVVISTRFH